MIPRDGLADVLQQNCLAGPRGCHDEPPLPLADRSQHIHDPSCERFLARFQYDAFAGIDRSQVVEVSPGIAVRRLAFNMVDAGQAGPGPFLGILGGTGHQQAFAQAKLLDERAGHVRIGLPRHIMPGRIPQETETLGMKLQDALD